ncbi:MAG: succinate dehydrogenase assembly factor 2 [Beijerinckiaceae bacterium]
MTGSTRTSADLDPRRKRILFRAWHRGIREMDLIMGKFCDASIATLNEAELDEFERLIDVPDRDLFAWLTGAEPTPAQYDTGLWQKLRDFHTHMNPLFN